MWKDILRAGVIALLLTSLNSCSDPVDVTDPGGGGGGGGEGGGGEGGGGEGGGGEGGGGEGGGGVEKDCPVAIRTTSMIRVVSGPQPCNDGPNWNGWNCVVLESTANNNGIAYQMECRWNLVDQTVRGSWSWMVGGASGTFFRDGQNLAKNAQDQLAAQDQVRSIDTRFVGGRGALPRNGDVNLSVVFADMYHWLVDNGVAEGVRGHFASSAGSATCAAAVANHGLHELLDGIVFGAGPTFIVLDDVCTAATDLRLRQGVDQRTYVDLTGQTPCELMRPDLAEPSFDCMSILGSEADLDYPNTMIAVLLGDQDPDLAFIEPQTRLYVSMITAQTTSVEVLQSTPHLVLKTNLGLNRTLARIREMVDAG